MIDAEVMMPYGTNATGRVILRAVLEHAAEAGVNAQPSDHYQGKRKWLVMWGVGGGDRSAIRDRHIAAGGKVVLWDIGFFKRTKLRGHCKASINQDYATQWLDATEPIPDRWDDLDLQLRNDCDPDGYIVLAGIGPKEHAYRGDSLLRWEQDKFDELQQRFPGRRIIYRPKPRREFVPLKCETDNTSEIADLLRGCALVVCYHSNVAVDAVLAGVPFESEAGVSTWLKGKPYTEKVRLDFVRRLARWQYKAVEMAEAWRFLGAVVGT